MTAAFNLSQLANNLNSSGQLDATDGLSGVISVSNGGTGASSFGTGQVLIGNNTGAITTVGGGAAGRALVSDGSSWVSGFPARLDTATAGSMPSYSARAWANFNGNSSPPGINASGNVSSITRNGTGDYTINFTTAMPDASYACVFGTLANDVLGTQAQLLIYGDDANPQQKFFSSVRVLSGSTGVNFFRNKADLNIAIFR